MPGITHSVVATGADSDDQVSRNAWNAEHVVPDGALGQAKVAGLVADLAGKAAAAHTHAQADVTDLVTALAGKQAAHANLAALAALDATAGIVRQTGASTFVRLTDTPAGRALLEAADAAAQRTALGLGTAALVNTGTGAANVPTIAQADARYAAIGSDGWTYVRLAADFPTSNTPNVSVTGFAFTPAASKQYLIEGGFILQTAVLGTGARPGVSWPTGLVDGVAYIVVPSGAFDAVRNANHVTGTESAPSAGLPVADRSYLSTMTGTVITGGAPSGDFQVTLASEAADATVVKMMTGSWLRYRVLETA